VLPNIGGQDYLKGFQYKSERKLDDYDTKLK